MALADLSLLHLETSSAADESDEPAPSHFAPPGTRLTGAALAWRSIVWLLIAAAFTSLIIQWSYRYGKLRAVPFYDDVIYMNDGLARLQVIDDGGWTAFIRSYRKHPPHAPFSTMAATFSYLVLGRHQWTPYATNFIIIFGLLAFVDYLCAGLWTWQRLSMFLLILAVPVSAYAVYEFRPDIPSGLCAAMGAILILRTSLLRASTRYRVTAGVIFGLALLFKPSTFPLSLLVFGSSLVLATVAEALLLRRTPPRFEVLRSWGECIGGAALVAGPHYLLDWRTIWGYIADTLFAGHKDVWQVRGQSAGWHLRYYLDGLGGNVMLGPFLYLLGNCASRPRGGDPAISPRSRTADSPRHVSARRAGGAGASDRDQRQAAVFWRHL